MAVVVKNADGTYTVTVTAKELQALKREASKTPPGRSAEKLASIITPQLASWLQDHLQEDGPQRLAKFAALPIPKQTNVDNILDGG